MAATRDPIGISSGIGIQSIMPTTGTSRRVAKPNLGDDHNTENTGSESNHEPPPAPAPGTGRLVDKAV
jgi:hypothetical protein